MRLAARLVLVLAGAILLGIAPAVAIETTQFGIDVAEESDDGRLHIAIKAGAASTGTVRVWNKTSEAIRLQLSIVAATVDENGSARLGGDDEAVSWAKVDPDEVELGPNADATVTVEVDAPRRLDGDTKTIAVLAEPAAVDGKPPAVLQRLAITTYLEPDEDSLIASLGPFPWIAAGVLVIVLALLGRRVMTRRGADSSERAAPS